MEYKDILAYMGADKEFETPEQFKVFFNQNFVRKQTAIEDEGIRKTIIGSTFKNVGQNIRKKLNEEYSLEIPNSELESKNLEDFVFDNLNKIKGSYESKLKEYEMKATEPNEALKEIEAKYSNLEKRTNEYKNSLKAIEQEYSQYRENSTKEFTNYKIDLYKKDALSKVKFKSDISDIEKIGYSNLIDSKYSIGFDENNEYIVTDKKGNRIPDTKVAGKFKTPFEVMEEEAINNGLIAKQQHDVKTSQKNTTFVKGVEPSTQTKFGNRVFFGAP